MSELLEIQHLNVSFQNGGAETQVISDLSLSLGPKETLGIVGESGSGKSVTSLAVMRLLPPRTSRVSGKILFHGQDLLSLSEREMESVRGNRIAMIFQEPMTSLNPIHPIGKQIAESVLLHDRKATKKQAMACDPDLLIADEPTTALDVTIQAQILDLMKDIKRNRDTSIIMITHDLGIVYDFCDKVAVFYTGEVVEYAPVKALFDHPLHPYTEGLIQAIPRLGHPTRRLDAIEGMVPDAGDMPQGCHFHPRCKYATERCRQEHPALVERPDGRCVRCFRAEEEA